MTAKPTVGMRKPITGTPEERRRKRAERRDANRVQHVKNRARAAGDNGRMLLVVACNAALAVSRRITNDARRTLAWEIAQAVERADVPENRKERP